MMKQATLMDVKECKSCGCILPDNYTQIYCPTCEENELFSQVKEYIRENVVNEYMVVEKFNIPLSKVKGWIKEGRIEYCEDSPTTLVSTSCQKCKKKILFGTLCTSCLRLSNSPTVVYMKKDEWEEKMRYF